ncbi:reverse transcriptase domain-containing protein [Tanacetum coccineum]
MDPNNNNGPPPAGPIPQNPAPDLRTMEEMCQPTMLGRGDDANKHIDKFLTVSQNMKQNGVPHDVLRLCLFPYSLTHHATAWFDRLPKNSIHSWEDMVTKFLSKYFHPSMGALPSNTIPNPREDIKVITTRSGITLARPSVPPPNSPSSTKELTPASKSNEIPKRNHHHPPIPYPSRLDKDKLQDKSNIQIHKFLQMFKKLHFNISFAEALAQMPKYAKMLKDLLTNKGKHLESANTPLNENCSTVLLKKLPEKLGDLGKFLIPCDFSELKECMALTDLGASINLMPLYVWKKLMLPELIPTRMTLELANQLVAYPVGIAEDVLVQVGKFTFPADFVVIDYDVDPCVPLIIGRPFLRTARASRRTRRRVDS